MTTYLDGNWPGSWGVWTPQRPVPERMTIVTDMPRRQPLSLRCELRGGDVYTPDGKARCECYSRQYLIREGTEIYIGGSFYLPSTFPVATLTRWHEFLQIKDDGFGSPPVGVQLSGSADQFRVKHYKSAASPDFDWFQGTGAGVRGRWNDLVLHMKASVDPATGFLGVWFNGSQRNISTEADPTLKHAATLDPAEPVSYLKVGYYRELSIPDTAYVIHNGWRIADSFDEVDPRNWN